MEKIHGIFSRNLPTESWTIDSMRTKVDLSGTVNPYILRSRISAQRHLHLMTTINKPNCKLVNEKSDLKWLYFIFLSTCNINASAFLSPKDTHTPHLFFSYCVKGVTSRYDFTCDIKYRSYLKFCTRPTHTHNQAALSVCVCRVFLALTPQYRVNSAQIY